MNPPENFHGIAAFHIAKCLVFRAHEESQRSGDSKAYVCAVLLAVAQIYMEKAAEKGVVSELPAMSFLGEKTRGRLGQNRIRRSTVPDMTGLNHLLEQNGYRRVTRGDVTAMNAIMGGWDYTFLNGDVETKAGAKLGDKEKYANQQHGDYRRWSTAVATLDYKNWVI